MLCGDFVNPAPNSSASKGVVRNMLGDGRLTSKVKSYGNDFIDYTSNCKQLEKRTETELMHHWSTVRHRIGILQQEIDFF